MIFEFEIKRIMKKNLIGYISIVLVSIFCILLYNIVDKNANSISESLINAPNEVLQIFDIDRQTFTTLNGYYAFIFKILSVITSIYAINLGIETAMYDKKNNIRDFLYAKPIKRSHIIGIRIIGASIYMLSLTLIVFITSIILFTIFRFDYNLLKIFQIDFSLFLLMLVFYSLGLVIGGFKNGKFPNILVSLITGLIFLIIHIIDSLLNINFLWYINPLSYFELSQIINDGYQYNTLIITMFILVFLMSFGIAIYENNLKQQSNKKEL